MSLHYRRIGRADLGALADLHLDPAHVEHFLGPLADIQAAVRRGPAHLATALRVAEGCVGFYVIHPDSRDGSCWWLGWLAMDIRQQGRGYGAKAMLHALAGFQRIKGCRRVRLLVAAENTRARGLYERAGFSRVGRSASTGELILELALPDLLPAEDQDATAVAASARRVFRHRRLRFRAGPHAAWVIGVERGPPSRPAAASPEHGLRSVPVALLAPDRGLGAGDFRL